MSIYSDPREPSGYETLVVLIATVFLGFIAIARLVDIALYVR